MMKMSFKGIKLNPKYIKDNNIDIDYEFYITNQLMKPISQVFSLVIENISGFKESTNYFETMRKSLMAKHKDEDVVEKKIKREREKTAENIIFDDINRYIYQKKNGMRSITSYF